MSVYIKDIGMPTTHPLTVTIYPDGQVLSETVGAKNIHGEAVPVPPHGRLIDADALMRGMGDVEYKGAIKRVLMQAPTIIPAEEGET